MNIKEVHKTIDLVGLTFGRLKVLEPAGTYNHKRHWICQCSCGKFSRVATALLFSGKTVSCGCLRVERHIKATSKRPYESLYGRVLSSKKNVELTYEQFLIFTEILECHYCDGPVVWSRHKRKGTTFACNLDRKDNSLGYSKENCVVCCPQCNRGKNACFTYEEWVVMTAALRKFRNESQKSHSATA
jgi:hypothetical protein